MATSALAQDYLWPTDASHWMTSAFAEYRPRRLHAAIDIKTWNRTGYKIFAVRDGYVERLRVSPFGYGKAIYLRLDTGEVALYAHLSGFNEKIEKIVAQTQEKSGRYRLNRYFKPGAIPVKKGDFLGFTGETGIGVPHLHFEMRDAKNRPINPLSKGYRIDDRVAPVPRKLAAIPLALGSRVGDDFKPQIFDLQRAGVNHYRVAQPISVQGEVGLAISGYDMTGTVDNKFGIYRLRLSIDGVPFYSAQYDRFSYANNRFADLDRDYRLRRRGYGRFYRLFLDPNNKLRFYHVDGKEAGRLITRPNSHMPGFAAWSGAKRLENGPASSDGENGGSRLLDENGTRVLAPGWHDILIELGDFFGNVTRIEGKVLAGERFRIRASCDTAGNRVALAHLEVPEAHLPAQVQVWQSVIPGRGAWVLLHEMAFPGTNGTTSNATALPVWLDSTGTVNHFRGFRFVAEDGYGVRSWPDFVYYAGPLARRGFDLELAADFYDDYVRLVLKSTYPLVAPPKLELSFADGSSRYLQPQQKDALTYLQLLPLREISGQAIAFKAEAESIAHDLATAEQRFDIMRIRKGQASELVSPDGRMRIRFRQNSLYRDLYGRINVTKREALGSDPELVTDVYRAEPADVLLNHRAEVVMAYPPEVIDPAKLGVYYKSGHSHWHFIDNKLDRQAQQVSAAVLSLETFALRVDDTPPVVNIRVPRAGQTISAATTIRAYGKDAQSGFESEESLELFIDGRKVIAEYDPEVHEIAYKPRKALAPGRHLLFFRATDRSGNIATTEREFFVQ